MDNNKNAGQFDRTGGGKGRRSRPNRARKDRQQSGNQTRRFQGLNKDELSGMVVTDEDTSTPLSQQYDALFEALITLGGKENPDVKTTLETFVLMDKKEFPPEQPDESEWTKIVAGKAEEIDCLKVAVMKSYTDERTAAGKKYRDCLADMKKPFPTVMGQLGKGMKEDIKSDTTWNAINKDNNAIELLKIIRDRCYRETSTKVMPALDLLRKARSCLTAVQENSAATTCVEATKVKREVLKALGASLRSDELIRYTLDTVLKDKGWSYDSDCMKMTIGSDELKTVHDAADQMLLATIVMEGSNDEHHGKVSQWLQQQHSTGHDGCPKTPSVALSILHEFKVKKKPGNPNSNHNHGGNTRRDQRNDNDKTNSKAGEDEDVKPDTPKAEEKAALVTNGNESEKSTKQDKPKKGRTEEAHQCLMNGMCDQHDNWGFAQLGVERNRERTNVTNITNATAWQDEIELMDGEECPTDVEPLKEKRRSEQVKKPRSGEASCDMQRACAFAQTQGGAINRNWILLDSQASCNVVCNPAPVHGIRKHPSGNTMTIHCNAGSVETDTIANLKGFGPVWCHPKGIANCLSLALVSDKCRVTLDTDASQTFCVHKPDGTTRQFHRATCDLHICDVSKEHGNLFAVTTVEGQEKQCSKLDADRARKARRMQDIMMHPSPQSYLKMIDRNQVLNCPITRRDIIMAEDTLGVNVNAVKGKTTRRQPGHVREDLVPVPHNILTNCGNVTVSMDVFHVNGIKFLRTISRHLMLRAARCIRNANKSTPMGCIKAVKALHAARGFTVVRACGDNEFTPIADDLADECHITFEAVARGAHEPHIERDNRTSKERARCAIAAAPHTRYPPRMIIELILAVDFWLDCWCSSGGVSSFTPPREITTGIELDAKKHCKFQFGDCVLAHNETDNTMNERASDATHSRTNGTNNGGFHVFDLRTARRVHRRRATLAHTTQTVIDRVHAIARAQDAPPGMTFTDMRNTSTILDIDTTEETGDDDASDDSYNPTDDATVETELTGVVTLEEDDPSEYDEDPGFVQGGMPPRDDGEPERMDDTSTEGDRPAAEAPNNEDGTSNASEQETVFEQHEDGDNEPHEIDIVHPDLEEHAEPETRRSARTTNRSHPKFCGMPGVGAHTNLFTAGFSRAINHLEMESHKFMLVAEAVEQYDNVEASLVTPQCGVKKGLRLFGEAGAEAVLKELKQPHDRKVTSPVDPRKMTKEEVRRALNHLMFLKRKRTGLAKGRGCADGRPQRQFVSREDASSPTVNVHAFFLSAIIDAAEERAAAAVDIPGAFLQVSMPKDEKTHIRLTGAMAKILYEIDPELHGPHMIKSRRGKREEHVICAQANEALHGTLRAALLFWKDLSGNLSSWGFEPNPCDRCAMNKMMDGNQCAIAWHVDDLKISHKSEHVVTDIINKLKKQCGKITPLTVRRGKVHECLGMTIDCSKPGNVVITMDDCLRDTVATLPEDLKTNRAMPTPAADHLFEVDDTAEKLSEEKAGVFHHCVAKLLFAAKRARPDTQMAVAFLCTRVKGPDVDDWKKLIRVLGYLKETLFLPPVLGADGTGNIHWHVDASFAVHNDMKSHTGAMMTLGRGAAISMSTKQKLNTKSSTEAEIVGVDDSLPFNMWCYCFPGAQGCHANAGKKNSRGHLGHTNILYQDNTSSIQLERNGKASSTKRTRAINIRYFLVTDELKCGDVTSIECKPTKEMIADCFAKPLQGTLFKSFRNTIMGITDADYLSYKLAHNEKTGNKASN